MVLSWRKVLMGMPELKMGREIVLWHFYDKTFTKMNEVSVKVTCRKWMGRR